MPVNTAHQSGTHCNHPKSTAKMTAHAWQCAVCVFGHVQNDMGPPLQEHTEELHCPKNLGSACSPLPTPNSWQPLGFFLSPYFSRTHFFKCILVPQREYILLKEVVSHILRVTGLVPVYRCKDCATEAGLRPPGCLCTGPAGRRPLWLGSGSAGTRGNTSWSLISTSPSGGGGKLLRSGGKSRPASRPPCPPNWPRQAPQSPLNCPLTPVTGKPLNLPAVPASSTLSDLANTLSSPLFPEMPRSP